MEGGREGAREGVEREEGGEDVLTRGGEGTMVLEE